MRIAIVNHSRRKIGGAEVYLDVIVPALAQAGHEIACLYESDPRNEREIINLPSGSPQWNLAELGRPEGLRQLRDWRPDICFTHGLHDLELESAIVESHRTALYLHNYYGTCISGDKTLSHGTPTVCERRFGPACLLHYFPDRCGGRSPLTMWKQYRLQSQRLDLMRRYSVLVSNSEHMTREMANHGLKAECVYYPVLTPAETTPEAVGIDGDVRLVFAGRMTTLKGGQYLLPALPEIESRLRRPLQLVLAGDGPARTDWEQMAQRLR